MSTVGSSSSRSTFRVLMFLRFTVVGATFPMVGLYVVERWGHEAYAGYLMSGLALMSLLTQQMWGFLADMVWPRRRILLMNIGIGGSLVLLSGFVPVFWAFLGVWLVIATFMTPVNPMMNAIVLSSKEGSGQYSEIRAWGTIGFIIACLGVGLLADSIGTTRICFFVAPVGALATWLWILRLDTPHVPPRQRASFMTVQRYFLSQPHFAWFLLALFVNRLAHAPMVYFQVFHARNLAPEGWKSTAATMLMVVGALAEVFVFFFGDRLIRRFGELRLLMVCTLIGAVRFSLVPFVGLGGLMALNVFHALSFGLYYLAGVAWMHRHTPAEIKTSAQTVYTVVFFGLSPLLGFATFGELFERFYDTHLATLFIGSSIIVALSALLLRRAEVTEPGEGEMARLPMAGESPVGQ